MGFIEGLSFTNFRVFKEKAQLEFAPITLLTGTNNSGKSTVINGLRLIQANYNDILYSVKSEKFDLNGVLLKDFSADAIIKRYGSLEKIVSFGNSEKKFSFSIEKKMKMIDDIAIIEFTIAIRGSKIKNGQVVKLAMKSKKTGEEIFCIKEAKKIEEEPGVKILEIERYDHHEATINQSYFYTHFERWIQKNIDYRNELLALREMVEKFINGVGNKRAIAKKIKSVNAKYASFIHLLENKDGFTIYDDPEYSTSDERELLMHGDNIERKKYKNIINDLKEGQFYNFSFLWKEQPEHEEFFKELIKKVYGEYSTKNLNKLNEDILQQLSERKWTEEGLLLPVNDEYSLPGVAYINFKNGFSLCLRNCILGNSNTHVLRIPGIVAKSLKPGKFAFLSKDLIKKVDNKDKLIGLLVEMIKERSKTFNTENLETNKPVLLQDKETKERLLKGEYNLPAFEQSEAEKYFNDIFIYHNLNLINECFISFRHTGFVSADRADNNRTKSLLEKNDLSRLVKHLFSINPDSAKEVEDFVQLWFNNFGISDKIEFEKDEDSENYKIYVERNGEKILLADIGYGATQLLPILLACFPERERNYDYDTIVFDTISKVVVIEEPESNLHPALQSKMADFFVAASKKFNIQFIIETHSEYLIRKLQYLTANGEIETNKTVIYYFYPPDKIPDEERQVKKIHIQDDGSLTEEFGTGFFDEADNIAMELFLLKQSQKN